ncbi:hypothetical protein GW916_00935 [bacterium]|nr:hypothetical protein [bacterium]
MRFLGTSLVLIMGLMSCQNLYRDLPNKSSDAYYIDKADYHFGRFEFDKALEFILPVYATQPNNLRVVKLAYGSYAGRAGLRSLDMITELGSASDGFFAVFAKHFQGADDDTVADVEAAIAILEGYSDDPAERDVDMNVQAMFLYYSQLGVVLNNRAYDSDNEVLGSFDACDDTDLPDEDLQKIVQAIPRAVDAASGVDETTASLVDSLNSNPLLSTFLTTQDAECPGAIAADVTACLGMRALINEGDSGIGIGAGALSPCP